MKNLLNAHNMSHLENNLNIDNKDQLISTFKTPTILGVAVISIFLLCILYHVIYKKFWVNQMELEQYRRNQRTINDAVSAILQRTSDSGSNGQESPENNSLPDYDDLPPSYYVTTPISVAAKREIGIQTEESTSFCLLPSYEQFRKSSSYVQTVV